MTPGSASGSVPVVAIDGPGGSGKGTVGRLVATRLGWHLLDSGALYRLVALAGLDPGLGADDERGYAALARALDVQFTTSAAGEEVVLLAGRDVTARLRTEATGMAASRVAAMASVRTALLARQRVFARPPGLVADGRGPVADVRYLDVVPTERGCRLYYEAPLPDGSHELRTRLSSG